MPEYLDVSTEFTVNLPLVDSEFGKNIENKYRSDASVNTDRCNAASDANACLNLGGKLDLKRFDINAVIKEQLQCDRAVDGNLNFKSYGNYPNNVLRIVLELIGNSALYLTGCKMDSLAVVFEYELTLKSYLEAVRVFSGGIALAVVRIVILLPERLILLVFNLFTKVFEYLFNFE